MSSKDERVFPTKAKPEFSLSSDQVGQMYVSCDRRGCPWIKPVAKWTTLDTLARMTKNHWHSA